MLVLDTISILDTWKLSLSVKRKKNGDAEGGMERQNTIDTIHRKNRYDIQHWVTTKHGRPCPDNC